MNEGKKGARNNHLTCDVCKIDFNSNADFALHEFSKKHCDNLIRLAKQKPIVSKQKVKSEIPQVEKEAPKVSSITHTGSFAKYGYFVPGQVYIHSEVPREFNTDYDPYLQKFAENPFKEKPSIQPQNEKSALDPMATLGKKKKNPKMCQVCNMTFLTLPEFEAHMKSPPHIHKLKMSGMGVSAHFVKASADLHTTDFSEESCKSKNEKDEEVKSAPVNQNSSSFGLLPWLYCSDCELLLNSPQQYSAHVNGKLHTECAQRKAELKEKKEKLENPMTKKLYCYSCEISLNNVFQYNEHKNGKKHRTRCRTLVRKGITIPPEERVPEIPHPDPNTPVVYPELYEKLVLEKQESKKSSGGLTNETNGSNTIGVEQEREMPLETSAGDTCRSESETNIQSGSEVVGSGVKGAVKCVDSGIQGESTVTTISEVESNSTIGNSMPQESSVVQQDELHDEPMPETEVLEESPAVGSKQSETNVKEEARPQVRIVTDDSPVNCSVCDEKFCWQSQLDAHLSSEAHLEKILKLKLGGKSEGDILKVIYSDRNVVKPNEVGEFSCSVCNVTTGNAAEFDHHLNSIVHKYTEKEYQKKRALEVKHMVMKNERDEYFCKACREGWTSLVDYTQHLHCIRHKTMQKAQRAKVVLAKRKVFYLQKQRLMQSLRKKNVPLRRGKTETPGVRTNTASQAPVPSLEPFQPKSDDAKNVSAGVPDPTPPDNSKNNSNDVKKPKRGIQKQWPNRRAPDGIKQFRGRSHFTPYVIPPLMPRPPHHRFPRPGFIPPPRHRAPFPNPRPPAFGPFSELPLMMNPYFRAQRIPRAPWPRDRPPYPRY